MQATTALIKYVAEVREGLGQKMTDMEVIRHVMQQASERKGIPELKLLLTEPQQKVVMDNLQFLEDFLKCEDGTDAVELLVITFQQYVAKRMDALHAPVESPVEEDPDETTY